MSWALEGGRAVTMHALYFYMVKRNCLFVSTFDRCEMKLPQHRKCPIIHPSSPQYSQKKKKKCHEATCQFAAFLSNTLNKLNVVENKQNDMLHIASHVVHMNYVGLFMKFTMKSEVYVIMQ